MNLASYHVPGTILLYSNCQLCWREDVPDEVGVDFDGESILVGQKTELEEGSMTAVVLRRVEVVARQCLILFHYHSERMRASMQGELNQDGYLRGIYLVMHLEWEGIFPLL